MSDTSFIELTADIVAAHVSHNQVATADIPSLIKTVFDALAQTAELPVKDAPRQSPAVAVRSSIRPDYLVCLENGAKLKMLKRYLRTNYAMSPEQYRAKWNLPADYPMVAPNYAAKRRDLAIKIGLGRKPDKVASPLAAARKRLGIAGARTPDAQPAVAARDSVDA